MSTGVQNEPLPARPPLRPGVPFFSSGPCAKRPGWSHAALEAAFVGRSHRSEAGRAHLRSLVNLTRDILEIPPSYSVAIIPGSDTGAIECAMWNFVGARGANVIAFDAFGRQWLMDVTRELRPPVVITRLVPDGECPALDDLDFNHDTIFCWNGTTSGVCLPSGDFIPDARTGLTICDATSAAFAMPLPWAKLDATTFSWQKALGGEAGQGMLVLSPRAVERLLAGPGPRPMPKIFRLVRDGQLIDGVFDGWTLNTPSLLCVEDFRDALIWARNIGGLPALLARTRRNAAALEAFVSRAPWLTYLAADPATRSTTSVCLRLTQDAGGDDGAARSRAIVDLLAREGVAFDIGAYRDAPPGLRIWCGPTIEESDIARLGAWLEWAYAATHSGA